MQNREDYFDTASCEDELCGDVNKLKLTQFFKYSQMMSEVSAPSVDHLVKALCPTDKPHKCLPYGDCYGRYHYCSAASKSAEPCVNETIMMDLDSRKKLCQDIAKGKNITELVRHPACNLKADCFDEFEAQLYPSTEDTDTTCPWTCVLAICLGIALVIAIMAAVTFAILYRRKKAKRNKNDTEQQRMLCNNNEAVNILTNNMMNEERLLGNGNQRQQTEDPEPDDTGNNTEPMSVVRRGGDDAANARNPPDSSRVPDPAVSDVNIDTSSGSVNYRNSNHSSNNSSASIDSESPEENRPSTSPNITRQEDHPAEVENNLQRAVHMPSSEPSGTTQIVTNQTAYSHTNNRRLE